MAIRFDGIGESLGRAADLLNHNNPYTYMFWAYISVDTNANATFFVISNGASAHYDWLRTQTDGVSLQMRVDVSGTGTNANGSILNVGQWYHFAVVRESATSLKVYLDGVLDITNTRDVTSRTAAVEMEVGALNITSNRLNGRVFGIKAWSVALSQAEVVNEMRAIRPMRLANLYEFWPCFPGSGERARGYSGNGRNWTANGTLSDEDPPPVSWGASALIIPGVPLSSQEVSNSDSGVGAEGTPQIAFSATEAGTGAEAASVSASLSDTDSGAGTEGTPQIALSQTDSGTGAEGTPSIGLSDSDSGAGAETNQVAANLSNSDSGAGAEGTPTIALSTTESGAGIESESLAASIATADAGTGAEAATIQVAISDTDSGTGAEAASIAAALSSSETGTGTDNGTVDAGDGSKSDSDSATGAETASIAATTATGETATATETASLAASLANTDSGAGAEGTPQIALQVADSGVGSETESILVLLADTDAGSGVESVAIAASLSSSDSGVGIDIGTAVVLSTVLTLARATITGPGRTARIGGPGKTARIRS